jgi:hypothetical protein
MRTFLSAIVVCALGMPLLQARSQASTETVGVPLTAEAHHHLVFTSSEIQAFYVVIPPGDHTLIHIHDVDYVWVGIGAGKVVNATVNKPEIHLTSKDAALHFTRGPLVHAARNVGDTVYRNVTVELLKAQTNPRNLCEQVVENQPTGCVSATPGIFSQDPGGSVSPEFETDQIRFDLVTLGKSGKVTISAMKTPPVIIALDNTQAIAESKQDGHAAPATRNLEDGNVMAPPAGSPVTLRNTGSAEARFLVFEYGNRECGAVRSPVPPLSFIR